MIAGSPIADAAIADLPGVTSLGDERVEIRVDCRNPFSQSRVIRAGVECRKRYSARITVGPRFSARSGIQR